MGLPTRRSKRRLPCGHSEHEMVYFGDKMACKADGRKWEWQPAAWREIVPKPKKGSEPEQSQPEPEEKGFFSRVLGKKPIPAQ